VISTLTLLTVGKPHPSLRLLPHCFSDKSNTARLPPSVKTLDESWKPLWNCRYGLPNNFDTVPPTGIMSLGIMLWIPRENGYGGLIHHENVPNVQKNVWSRKIYAQNSITRNSSGDEISNVNFLYDEIVHAVKNTIHRSRSYKVTEFGTNRKLMCNFRLLITTNLAPILHRFRDIAFDRSKITVFGYPSCV